MSALVAVLYNGTAENVFMRQSNRITYLRFTNSTSFEIAE